MIPVLQQMFAPIANAGGGTVAVASGEPNSGGFDIGTSETGADIADSLPIGGFSTVFAAPELPEPVIGEDTDISAAALVDAGAIFALQQTVLPEPPPEPPMGGAIAPMIQPTIAAAPAAAAVALPEQGIGADVVLAPKGDTPPVMPLADPVPMDEIPVPSAVTADLPKAAQPAPQIAAPVADPEALDRALTQAPSLPPQFAQATQIMPILPRPIVASMAESMFQTQIETQDVAASSDDAPAAPTSVAPTPAAPTSVAPTPMAPMAAAPMPTAAMPIAGLAVLQGGAVGGPLGKTPPLPVMQAVKTVQNDARPADPTAADHGATVDLVPNTAVPADSMQNLMQDAGGSGAPLPIKSDIAPLQSVQTPVSAPLPHLPTTAAHLAAQILPHSPAARTGPIEVLLNPAELGHLRFEIHQKGEHVQVVLSAERPETLDLLRRNSDQLATEFRNAGFAGASLSFGQWGRSSDGQPPASFIANAEDDFAPVVLPQMAKPPMAQDNSRNLNLRL